ncbi:MAG: ABC transporter permease [Ramlibacter sp.]
MGFLLSLAWRDLRASGRRLWIFCACLVLGVSLVTAAGSLHRQVADAMRSDARQLLGGDVEVASRDPLPPGALQWMRERGAVSRVIELRTMLLLADGRAQLVELQSADAQYPLYGQLEFAPAAPLADALGMREGRWGIAVDGQLATRLGLRVGETVTLGDATLVVRALIVRQPDRSLRADWRGEPVLVSAQALAATGLVQPLSRVDYLYRTRTDLPPAAWSRRFVAAFPDLAARVRTFEQRSARMAEVLGQIGSGLMLIGFSALFIGGLGVFNSVQAYLQGKLATLAVLRALGLRDGRVAAMVLLQVLMLAVLASAAGVLLGNLMALGGTAAAAARLPLRTDLASAWLPSLLAWAFGVLTALCFALPAVGRALSVRPAVLFRGIDANAGRTPPLARILAGVAGGAIAWLMVAALPDPRFGLAFLVATGALLLLLEGIRLALQRAARALLAGRGAVLSFELRVAVAAMQRSDSPLRAALLSLGTALTLLVACTLVVASLLRAVNETVPQNAPSLVFYDVQTDQLDTLRDALGTGGGLRRLQTAPLVLGRLVAVNGALVADSADPRRARQAREEHKLSTRAGNVDDVVVERGAWWPAAHGGQPLVAMEDREADQLGLRVGDLLRFEIMGTPVEAQLAAIYGQRRMQARLWLEAIFSDGVLDPFITRHVGAAWLDPGADLRAQQRVAAAAPAIASVRTEALLRETRALMGRASGALVLVAGVCLAASLLVLASVVAASRARHVYEATVMHALGARLSSLRRVLLWEYLLLALVTGGFAMLAGSALATGLLRWRLDIDPGGVYWTGAVTAAFVSVASLGLGARHLMAQMRLNPALLLRAGT